MFRLPRELVERWAAMRSEDHSPFDRVAALGVVFLALASTHEALLILRTVLNEYVWPAWAFVKWWWGP